MLIIAKYLDVHDTAALVRCSKRFFVVFQRGHPAGCAHHVYRDGHTIEHWAAQHGRVDTLENLLCHRRQFEEHLRPRKPAEQNRSGPEPLLLIAAANGHANVFGFLLSNGSAVDEKNRDDATALHRAAGKGSVACTKRFLSVARLWMGLITGVRLPCTSLLWREVNPS